MIVDKLSNIGRYALIIKDCDKLESFVKSYDFSTIAGKHPVEGSDMDIAPFEYDTKLNARWETHHTHMDIHVIIEGADERSGFLRSTLINLRSMCRSGM